MTAAPDPRTWSRLAGVYDSQLALERRALREMLAMVAPTDSDRLLDLATGTGAVLRELAKAPARPARVVGVDTSGPMLARAARSVPGEWELIHADAAALPFGPADFKAVTCAYLLHLLDQPRREAVLGETMRVLAPGGRLGVVTVAAPVSSLARLVTAPVQALGRRSTGALAGLRALDPRDELRAAGFEVEATRRVLRGYPSLCVLARRPRANERPAGAPGVV